MDIAQLGIKIDSQSAVKAEGDLERLTVAAGKADAAADRLAENTGKVAPAMAGAGQGSRMLALQLSQVAQQTSATGNFVQALAIQLPDMAIGFGAVGIAASIVASVALPALVSALSSGESEIATFDDAMDELKSTMEALGSTQDILGMSAVELAEKYGEYGYKVREAAAALAELQIAQAQAQLAETIIEGADALNQFAGAAATAFSSGVSTQEVMVNLRDTLGLTGAEAINVSRAFQEVRDAITFEDRLAALRELDRLLTEAGVSASQLPPEIRDMLIESNQVVIAMAELADTAEDARVAVASLSESVPGAGWLDGAIDGAYRLAQQLWDAAAAKAAAISDNLAADDERGSQRDQARSAGEFRSRQAQRANVRSAMGLSGGGGGGGGVDQYAADLEALVGSLESEREILDAWYEESQMILEDRRAQEILGTQAHKDALLALEEEYQQRLAEIEGTSQSQRLSDTASFFGSLATIASAGGGKTAKAVAAFQAIEGTINAYGAAIKALNTPGITLAGRFAAYASVLAAGLKGVAAIRSAGGVGGGGGGAGTIAAQGQQQAQQQTVEYVVRGIDRDALYTGEMFARIFDGLTEEASKRGMQTAVRFV